MKTKIILLLSLFFFNFICLLAKDDMPEILYSDIKQVYAEEDFSKAIHFFDEFIQTYPESYLVANCLYWKAEAYYDLKEYYNSLKELEKIIANYPKSNKHPDALYKSALIYIKLNKDQNAEKILHKLLAEYPNYIHNNIIKKLLSKKK